MLFRNSHENDKHTLYYQLPLFLGDTKLHTQARHIFIKSRIFEMQLKSKLIFIKASIAFLRNSGQKLKHISILKRKIII